MTMVMVDIETLATRPDIMEGKDTRAGTELDAIGKQIKLSAICRIAETYLNDDDRKVPDWWDDDLPVDLETS